MQAALERGLAEPHRGRDLSASGTCACDLAFGNINRTGWVRIGALCGAA